MKSKPLLIHDPERLQAILKDVYGIPRLTVLQAQEVSALRERSHGTVKLNLGGADESMAYLHWSKPQVKNLRKEDLRDFCLPLQMWARGQGLKAPPVWCTKSGEYLWDRNGLACFVESFKEGGPTDAWQIGHLETMGNWLGRLHRSLRAYSPWCLRSLHLNLDRIHERWIREAKRLLKEPFEQENDPREELRLQVLDYENLLDQAVDEFRRTQVRSGPHLQQCIHGDLNFTNIFWSEDGRGISGVIDWKACRFDCRLVDLLRPTRDHIFPEGNVAGSQQLRLLRALFVSYCAESGPLSLDEANLFIPALIMLEISFLVWQLKQPVYPPRALTRLKDIPRLWALRHEVAENIIAAGHPVPGSRRGMFFPGVALPRRIELFPYSQSQYQDYYRNTLLHADAVVFHLPALCKPLALELASKSVKPLAYISLAKAPVIKEVASRSAFLGGSPSFEEVVSNPFWSAVQVVEKEHIAAWSRHQRPRTSIGKMKLKDGWVEACVHAEDFEDRALSGIRELLKQGFQGLFIDNVIDRLTCHAPGCPGRGRDPWKVQRTLLFRICSEVKKLDPEALIVINAGRRFLLNPYPAADIVMVEGFGFSDSDFNGFHEEVGLRLASRRYGTEDEFLRKAREMADRVTGVGSQLLGYTKVSRHYLREEIDNKLALARRLATQSGILWTTRLKRYTSGKPWDID